MRKLLAPFLTLYALLVPAALSEAPRPSVERRIVEYMEDVCRDGKEVFIVYNPVTEKILTWSKGGFTRVDPDDGVLSKALKTEKNLIDVHCHPMSVDGYISGLIGEEHVEKAKSIDRDILYNRLTTWQPSTGDFDSGMVYDYIFYAKPADKLRHLIVAMNHGRPRLIEHGFSDEYINEIRKAPPHDSERKKLENEYRKACYDILGDFVIDWLEEEPSFEKFAERVSAGGNLFVREIPY